MLVIRNCFVARPGQASKLAAQLKEASTAASIQRVGVLTDLTGDFNRVILAYEAENIGAFEAPMAHYATDAAFRDKMKGYTDHWLTVSREILEVV